MKLQILLYSSVANPLGIPGTWPFQVRLVDDSASAPVAPWLEMSLDAYQSYLTAHQAEYDTWLATQSAAKDSNIATLTSQYDAAISAIQTFDGIASPTTAQAVAAVQTHNKVFLKLLPLLRRVYIDSLQ